MSKFRTVLAVDVAGVLACLPKGSAVTNISLNDDRTGISIFWEHDDFKTLYSFPVDCPDPGNPPVSGHKLIAPLPVPAVAVERGRGKKKR